MWNNRGAMATKLKGGQGDQHKSGTHHQPAKQVRPYWTKGQSIIEVCLLQPREQKRDAKPDRGNVQKLEHGAGIASTRERHDPRRKDKWTPPKRAATVLHFYAAKNFILRNASNHHAAADAFDLKAIAAHAEFPFSIRQRLLAFSDQEMAQAV